MKIKQINLGLIINFILTESIRNPNIAFIYHCDNQYTTLCGFYEEPWSYIKLEKEENKYSSRRDWLVIAEQSTSFFYPIRMEKWKDFLELIEKDNNYGLIKIEKS